MKNNGSKPELIFKTFAFIISLATGIAVIMSIMIGINTYITEIKYQDQAVYSETLGIEIKIGGHAVNLQTPRIEIENEPLHYMTNARRRKIIEYYKNRDQLNSKAIDESQFSPKLLNEEMLLRKQALELKRMEDIADDAKEIE